MEDDEDGISDTVFDFDDGLEEGEIGPDADSDQIPGAEIGRNSLVDDSDEIPAGRAIVIPKNSVNQHIEPSNNDEIQKSEFNSLTKLFPSTIPSTTEMEKTVEVGRLLGFDIREGCEILEEVMGDIGEQNCEQ